MEKDFNNIKNDGIEVEAKEYFGDLRPLNSLQLVEDEGRRTKVRRFFWMFAASILLLVVLFTTLVFSTGKTGINLKTLLKKDEVVEVEKVQETPQNLVPPPAKREGTMSSSEIYKKVSPAVVGVITSEKATFLGSNVAQGTGLIFTPDGYILTNAHVIGNDKNNSITVIVNEKEYAARTVGFDSSKDIAVLKIDANNLQYAELGDSDKISVGEEVLALGNPGGMELSKTLTKGIISAEKRRLDKRPKKSKDEVQFIQYDAAINRGNSGGPLINMSGQVIGIVSRKIADIDNSWEGLGFAIPINTARDVANKIMKGGCNIGNVRLGITARSISKWESQVHDVPPGALILQISENSSLKGSGIRQGDVIVKINETKILDTEILKEELQNHKPGDVVDVTVFRPSASWKNEEGTMVTVKITLLEDK